MLLKGVGAGISPSRMKNNTCQRVEELLASQRPTCISVVANSWKGSPQTAASTCGLRCLWEERGESTASFQGQPPKIFGDY